MDRGALGEVGVDPHHRLRSPLTPGVSHAKGAASRSATAKLALLVGAAIVAPPPHGNPLWMLADPLRDVGLRIHDALIERHVGRERKMLIFALTRWRQCADCDHQFDQAHPQFYVNRTILYVVSRPGVSSFPTHSWSVSS